MNEMTLEYRCVFKVAFAKETLIRLVFIDSMGSRLWHGRLSPDPKGFSMFSGNPALCPEG